VLLIACVNVTNLLLARRHSAERNRDSRRSVRTRAPGPPLARRERADLSEAAGLLVVSGVFIVDHSPADIPRLGRGTQLNVLLFCLAVCLASGLSPVLRLRGTVRAGLVADPPPTHGGRTCKVCSWSRSLPAALPCAAGLMFKTLWVARSNTTPFDPDHVLAVFVNNRQMPGGNALYFAEVTSRIEALPGVHAAAGIGCGSVPFQIAGRPAPPGQELILGVPCVSLHFPVAAGLRLVAGRWFDDRDREGAPNVTVVNEAASRIYSMLYPNSGSIIGQRIDDRGQPDRFPTVIGVISDLRLRPDADPEPQAQADGAGPIPRIATYWFARNPIP
jgi:hypothetical protein